MADPLSFLPVIQEDARSIRARLDADMNAGLDPTDPGYTDVTPGGWYYDTTQGFVLEQERLYDTMGTDVPASFLPRYAWGTYLDELGFTVDVFRNDAVKSTGEVTFTGEEGALIATGTQVAVTRTDPDEQPIVYVTTESGTITGGTVTLAVEAVTAGSRANVAAGIVDMCLTPNSGVEGVENAEGITGGADIETDDRFRVRVLLEWQAAHGGGTVADYAKWALDHDGIGFVRVIAVSAGPGTVRVIVTDADNHPLSDEILDDLQLELDPPSAATTLASGADLPDGTIDLTDASEFESAGRVRIGQTVVAYSGKSTNTLTGCVGGTGIFDIGEPVYQVGKGGGHAPIGAIALVSTPAVFPVDIDADISFEDGYSLDGLAGTVATRDDITEAVQDYLNHLTPGEDPVANHVIAQVFLVPGVEDVVTLTMNGSGAASLTVTDDQVVESGDITLT